MLGRWSRRKSSKDRRLLITSDDMGMTVSVNRGVERALRDGLVGATNLMVPCPSFQDAAQRVKDHRLPAGIHLTLTSEWDHLRWGPLTECSNLRASDGCFHRSYAEIPGDLSQAEIYAEFEQQLRVLRSTGIEPTHIDTHMISSESSSATELKVKSVVRQICSEQDLIYTYDTDEAGRLVHFESETLGTPMTGKDLKKVLRKLGPGVHHLVTHCAEKGEDLEAMCSPDDPARPWAVDYRVKDLDLLTSEDFRSFLRDEGFELLDMHQFLKGSKLAPRQQP